MLAQVDIRRFTLEFRPALDNLPERKELRDGLSAVLQVGRTLWVANDESATVERLTLQGRDCAAAHRQFDLDALLDLPAPGGGRNGRKDSKGRSGKDGKARSSGRGRGSQPRPAGEVDVEGLHACDGWMWVVGSHSLKRSKPRRDDEGRPSARRLARIEPDANRFLLARIPLVDDEDGLPALARRDGRGRQRRVAARLGGGKRDDALTRLLRKDRHLGPFLGLPGKENGFDVEGIAAAGERLFLGLRGPVLRGFAVVLELKPRCKPGSKEIELGRVGDKRGRRLRKHFLELDGLGVRDLFIEGEDILLLAGPTMDLDGPVRVLRWAGGAVQERGCVVRREQLQTVLELPYGAGCDHAEGMALLDTGEGPARLLVVYDSCSPQRQTGVSTAVADLFDWPGGTALAAAG